MKQITEKAPAKLNLFLEVGNKREDGFHDIVSVMQSVSVMDELTLTLREDETFTLQSGKPYLPCDDRNVALAAAKLFAKTYGITRGCHIDVKKGIPVTAGIGGGSADAAAVLRAMCRLYGIRATKEELLALAEQIGSDVPFCVAGGTALATGRGETLQSLNTPELQVLLFRNGRKVSTAHAYAALDAHCRSVRSEEGMVQAVQDGEASRIAGELYNAFSPLYEENIKRFQELCAPFSPLGIGLSGAGPTCFALFAEEKEAVACCRTLRRQGGYARTCHSLGALHLF